MQDKIYIVYVQTDERGCIIAVNSSAFVPDNWGIKIDEGTGDKYHHAQGNYFPEAVCTIEGIPRYKLVDGKPIERTEEEIQADRDAIVIPPTPIEILQRENELLKAQLQASTERSDFIEDCIAEMAMVVYSQ